METGKFVKCVVFPVVSVMALAILFKPLCMENGACDYLKLWFFMGIPFGIHRMFLWMIPKGYDLGGAMGVLAVNLLIGSVIGMGVILWRLGGAIVYLVKGLFAGIKYLMQRKAAR